MTLNPLHPSWCNFALFHSHFLKGEYEKSESYISTIKTPDWFWPHALQAIIYTQIGNEKSAALACDNLRRLYPDFSKHAKSECEKWFQRDEDIIVYLKGLKKAGLME